MKEIDEMHYAVDVPPSYPNNRGEYDEWINVEYFETREEAIKFAQYHFGADEEGKICLISNF